jgi:hypothetical protein
VSEGADLLDSHALVKHLMVAADDDVVAIVTQVIVAAVKYTHLYHDILLVD